MINNFEELAIKLYADYELNFQEFPIDASYSNLVANTGVTNPKPLIKIYNTSSPYTLYATGKIRYNLRTPYKPLPSGYTEIESLYDNSRGLYFAYKSYTGDLLEINNTNDDIVLIEQTGRRGFFKTPADFGFLSEYQNFGTYLARRNYRIVSGEPFLNSSSDYYVSVFLRTPIFKDKQAINDAVILPNCFKLTDAIDALFAKTIDSENAGLIQANLFTSTTDILNPETSNIYNNIYLIQSSDFKRPYATNKASVGEISFNQLMTALMYYFNVRYKVKKINNGEEEQTGLYIYHVSEITDEYGIDFTIGNYAKYIGSKNKYTYDFTQLKKIEQWSFDYAVDENFKGLPIDYELENSFIDEIAEYKVPKLITDITQLQINPNNIPDESFVMLIREADSQFVKEGVGAITGVTNQNMDLSIANLHEKLHKHGRLFKRGIMNNKSTLFESTVRIKQQDSIQVKLNIDDFIEPEKLQKSEIGWGEVKKVEISLRDLLTDIILLHDVD